MTKLKIIGATTLIALSGLGIAYNIPPKALYPDIRYTTGLADTSSITDLTATYNGNQTYSQAHRDVPNSVKELVMQEYGNPKGKVEIDHFIPLAIGGSNNPKNLWPQPEHVKFKGRDYGFHTKDRLETYLVYQVKHAILTPTEAQNCIKEDWVKCYDKYFPPGITGSFGPDYDEEDDIIN